MADLDDMEMVKCPHCGKTCPRDFYPICSCEKSPKTNNTGTADKKPVDPYDY